MKQMKRLFSVLLAVALTAQMGMVAGFGAGSCNVEDHGKAGQNVTNASSCSKGIHWLGGGGTTLTGGGGTNYFYVTGGEIVDCKGTRNVIVAQKIPTAQVTVSNFTFGKDELYICGATQLTSDKDANTYWLENDSNERIVEFDVKTPDEIPAGNIAKDLPANFDLAFDAIQPVNINLNQPGTISASLKKQGQGKLTYSWEKSADSGANWTPILGAENASYTVPSEDTTAPAVGLQYRCTVMDEIGQTDSVVTTVNVVGCTVTASFNSVYSIPNQDISNTDNTQVTLPNVNAIVNIGNKPCTMNHTGHGYTIEWAKKEPAQPGVSITGNTMTLDATQFQEGSSTLVTLTATLKKEGQDVAAPPTTQDYTFTVTREAAPVAPTCNASATLGALTVNNGGNIITGEKGDTSFTVAMNVAGGTSPCQVHGTDANHGYTVEWELTPAVEGVTLVENGNSGTLKIEKEKLPIPTQTTASLTAKLMRDGQPTSPSATTSVSFQQIACQAKPVGITLTTPARTTPEVVVDHSNAAATVFNPFTAAVTGWTGECSEHTTSGDHNKSISWSIASAPQGVTINSATGDLTVDGTKLTQEKTTVQVTATVTANGVSQTATADVTLSTTILKCEKKVTAITIQNQNDNKIALTSTGTFTKTYTTEIVYGSEFCNMGDNHSHATVAWGTSSIEISPAAEGAEEEAIRKAINIGPTTGQLTITGKDIPLGKTIKATLTATATAINGQSTESGSLMVEITRTAPPPPPSSDNTESVEETNRREWESFEDKIDDARRGSTLRMSLNGNTDCPFYIFDAIRGRDLTLELKVDNNYTWTVNGKSLKKLPSNLIYLSLDVEKYRNSKMISLCRGNDVKAFQLGHEGSFYGDMKLTMDVGAGNAKKTMFLYSYDEDKEKLTYCTSAIADSRGDATFTFTRSLGAYVVTSKALYGENPVSSGGGVVGSGSRPSTVYPPVASSTPRPSTSVPPPPSSSSASSSSESSSSSSESSSSESIPAPPPSSSEPAEPVDTPTQPEEKQGIPFLVPALILAIAGVITATVLVVRSGKGKEIDFDD